MSFTELGERIRLISTRPATKTEPRDYEEESKKISRGSGTDDLRKEYRFDYRRAKPNRFAARLKAESVAVVLDPDVALVFRASESVNVLFRSVLAAILKTASEKGSGPNNAMQRTGAAGKRSARR